MESLCNKEWLVKYFLDAFDIPDNVTFNVTRDEDLLATDYGGSMMY